MNNFDIIKTVRVTEKATRLSDNSNQYTLVVDRRANALQIRHAVEDLFKVKVIKVNTMNVRGKMRRQKTKAEGQTSDCKKAVVTLKKDDKITLV